MELWFIILISISIAALLKALINFTNKPTKNLPPGPFTIPIISNILWLRKSLLGLEPILRSLSAKLGPVITLHIGPITAIFVSDRSLIHQALVQNGPTFANRPPPGIVDRILSCNQHNINSAPYGPTWRLLRRNLTAEILHPSRVRAYSQARRWVLQILIDRLKSKSEPVTEDTVLDTYLIPKNAVINFMVAEIGWDPKVWEEPMSFKPERFMSSDGGKGGEVIDITGSKEIKMMPFGAGRRMCPGYGLAILHLEYFVANLVWNFLWEAKDGDDVDLSEKLEFTVVMKNPLQLEDDLQRMPYLKAVILKSLRRHPPRHFLLPHAVTEDTVLDTYLIPKNAIINLNLAEMGWDPKVWEDTMSFKPERFMSSDGGKAREVIDITGSKEINMMPFGTGRRMCPGYGLAILHVEYFVANLVWNFVWEAKDGDDVDLSEKMEFTVVMKNPLLVYISPRSQNK
ncbi:cytochrome P450 89A2-like [Tripterygium wilfordii]|uniref:Cytochrome P450 89A2-like n=1 Tax=Tripterygium wilfordii TaxID=458696 RepID=A0A7J7BVF9_TRIWF|nr:cytochrome P450 89A2-like [Tripterygium wilfordii]